jgi:hypothetical protein
MGRDKAAFRRCLGLCCTLTHVKLSLHAEYERDNAETHDRGSSV